MSLESLGAAGGSPLWEALSPREHVRIIKLLVHRVEYDAADSSIEVTFFPSGIKALAAEGGPDAPGGATVETAA